MDDFGKRIGALSRTIGRYLRLHIASNICHDLSWANILIIMYIFNNPDDVYQKDMERDLKVTRSTLSKEMSLLRKKGYLELKPESVDKRLKKLSLTQKALDLAQLLKADSELTEKLICEGFTSEEKATLSSYLSRMESNIQKNIQLAISK